MSRGDVYGARYVESAAYWKRLRRKLQQVPYESWSWRLANLGEARRVRQRLRPWPYAVQTNYRPGSKRQKVIVLFSSGVLNKGFIDSFRRLGLKYFFLDFKQFMERGRVEINMPNRLEGRLRMGPAELRFADVGAVVWVAPMVMGEQSRARPLNSHLFIERWRHFLQNMSGLFPEETVWLPSHPLNGSYEWQRKLAELAFAREAGLGVAPTLYTNDPEKARAFIARWKGRVLFREFSRVEAVFRTVFADAGGKDMRSLPRSPCGFQKYIDKEYEVRAVVIGDRVFAARIDSQASHDAKMDWRCYDNAHVRWDRMKLPRSIKLAMLRLMKRLDLKWGSFDLIKSTDGEFYFLEVNRPGAQYWLLPFVGFDATKEIASYLRRVL